MIRHGLYTISSGTGFLKRLAEGLQVMSEGDDLALTQMRVLLPTRRAGRELRAAFLSLSPDKPVLLPRLQPIGDVDAEDIDLYLSGFGMGDHDIPPAISALERQFLLATLIQKKDPDLGLDAALALANDLARLIDTVYTENMDFSGLARIVPDTLATHWQKTLEFLEIVTEYWPLILAERGQIDPSDRRNRLLKSLATLWRHHPPEGPVIAAGSTGSIPSAGDLLKTIAELPLGCVVLPGLDRDLDDASWDAFTDTHPQATLRNLLRRMNKTRADVRLWPETEGHSSPRAPLLRAVMRPAETFGQTVEPLTAESLDRCYLVETATPREEAAVIALALRETLETPGKTACFVTPDRMLARRVMTALHRWGIDVDDSAGGALATTRGATFLVALLRMVVDDFAPLSVLDFLKHDYQRLIPPDHVAAFERHVLRGSRPANNGLDGLQRRIDRLSLPDKIRPKVQTDIQTVMDHMAHHIQPLIRPATDHAPLDTWCQSMLTAAEAFAGGAEFLWSRPESDALSHFVSSVMSYSDVIPPLDGHLFTNVFREVLSSEKYRADDEPHRRILILGQLESRLIHRDMMILGGLNEGTWPKDPGHDPWMSRPMRRNFGLPPADRGTGLAAHDFVEHVSSAEVMITRSLKMDGTATVPARWIQKWRTILKSHHLDKVWNAAGPYGDWVAQLDTPQSNLPLTASAPAPCPPRAVRPQELSATWIEKWMKNPYRVYAEKILKLKRLDPVDMDKTHADRGSFVHDVFLDFVRAYPHQLPDQARDILLDIGRKKLDTLEHIAPHWHYWWPRFERVVDWFLTEESRWRGEALPWIQEETGSLTLYHDPDSGRNFTVTAKADRIDRLKTGGVAVMDYKTGAPPSMYKIKNGTAPQLPIESLILARGGYRGQSVAPQAMIYWKLSGSHATAGMVKPVTMDMDDTLAATEDGLLRLITAFEHPETPYMAQAISGTLYDDEHAYAHLSRMSEWSSGDTSDPSDAGDDNGEEPA